MFVRLENLWYNNGAGFYRRRLYTCEASLYSNMNSVCDRPFPLFGLLNLDVQRLIVTEFAGALESPERLVTLLTVSKRWNRWIGEFVEREKVSLSKKKNDVISGVLGTIIMGLKKCTVYLHVYDPYSDSYFHAKFTDGPGDPWREPKRDLHISECEKAWFEVFGDFTGYFVYTEESDTNKLRLFLEKIWEFFWSMGLVFCVDLCDLPDFEPLLFLVKTAEAIGETGMAIRGMNEVRIRVSRLFAHFGFDHNLIHLIST